MGISRWTLARQRRIQDWVCEWNNNQSSNCRQVRKRDATVFGQRREVSQETILRVGQSEEGRGAKSTRQYFHSPLDFGCNPEAIQCFCRVLGTLLDFLVRCFEYPDLKRIPNAGSPDC